MKRPVAFYKKYRYLPDGPIPVKVKARIAPPKECRGFFVKEKYIQARKAGAKGTYHGFVPGAGGDIWWIKHEDGSVGAYVYDELTDVN